MSWIVKSEQGQLQNNQLPRLGLRILSLRTRLRNDESKWLPLRLGSISEKSLAVSIDDLAIVEAGWPEESIAWATSLATSGSGTATPATAGMAANPSWGAGRQIGKIMSYGDTWWGGFRAWAPLHFFAHARGPAHLVSAALAAATRMAPSRQSLL